MRCLLDTHVLLWAAQGNDVLTSAARDALLSGECHYSIASLWEIAIKQSLGKLELDAPLAELDRCCLAAGLRRLPISVAHLERLAGLPDIHRDPFDRLLVAHDRLIPRYPVATVW